MKTSPGSLLIIITLCINQTCAYNVLFILPFGSSSHRSAIYPVAEELAKREHKVTIAAATGDVDTSRHHKNINNVELSVVKKVFEENRNTNSFFTEINLLRRLWRLHANFFPVLINATFQDPFVQDIITNPRDPRTGMPRFDVVVIDCIFNEFTLVLAHHMNVPSIYFSPTILLPSIAWSLNIPHPIAYIPNVSTALPGRMSFLQRIVNVAAHIVVEIMRSFFVLPKFDQCVQKYFPDCPPLHELERNVSFVFSNTHPVFSNRIPRMPYFIEVGGLHCKPGKPLPQELEDFMQSSAEEEGVIYFSLGSQTKGTAMPLEMRDKILEAFSQLPHKVLWKYEDNIAEKPVNVKLINWGPQQDILAHPKVKLFITHGGALSTQEAIYHQCPLLGFPLSVDQWGNMVRVSEIGIGDYLDWKSFTSEEFLTKIKKLMTDKRYKDNVIRLSELMKDRPIPAAVESAYWIEYVIKHRGAPHLKSDAEHLNFYQYFLLDIIGLFVVTVSLCLISVIFLLKCIRRRQCCHKNAKTLTKKKKK